MHRNDIFYYTFYHLFTYHVILDLVLCSSTKQLFFCHWNIERKETVFQERVISKMFKLHTNVFFMIEMYNFLWRIIVSFDLINKYAVWLVTTHYVLWKYLHTAKWEQSFFCIYICIFYTPTVSRNIFFILSIFNNVKFLKTILMKFRRKHNCFIFIKCFAPLCSTMLNHCWVLIY